MLINIAIFIFSKEMKMNDIKCILFFKSVQRKEMTVDKKFID